MEYWTIITNAGRSRTHTSTLRLLDRRHDQNIAADAGTPGIDKRCQSEGTIKLVEISYLSTFTTSYGYKFGFCNQHHQCIKFRVETSEVPRPQQLQFGVGIIKFSSSVALRNNLVWSLELVVATQEVLARNNHLSEKSFIIIPTTITTFLFCSRTHRLKIPKFKNHQFFAPRERIHS